jgi:DNA-binding response OmpR family regulator
MNPQALVIEDTEDIALIFHKALEVAGFDVDTFYDGTEGLDYLKTSTPSLVVLDMHLPGASGEDILQFIRSENRLKDTNVIIATADATWGSKLEDAATLTVLKPVGFMQLKELATRLRPTL